MVWALIAGALAGLVLGYLGAGGTVVGIPFVIYLAGFSAHQALGSNAIGVALIALVLVLWRIWKRQMLLWAGIAFTLPGLAGIYLGAQIGLVFPGQKLVFLLGILLFFVAGWLFYLSLRPHGKPVTSEVGPPALVRRLWLIIPVAFVVGTLAGFFAIGGGFMIVPALAMTAGIDLLDAAAAGLLPITAFAGWIGVQYWIAGAINLEFAALMVVPGLLGGIAGITLGKRLSPRTSQRIFAVFLFLVGIYMTLK
jgi:uncharacterized membrane protein YfcA